MTQLPRVVFIAPNMTLGGAERQLHLLLRRLDRSSFTPVLITLNAKGEFYEHAEGDGVECHHLALRGKFPLRGFWELTRLLRRPHADVVVMRGFSATVLGRLAAMVAGVPTRIITEHSIGWVGRPRGFNRVVDWLLIPFTTVYVGVAEAQMDFLVRVRRLPASRIEVIHNGIMLPEHRAESRSSARSSLGIDASAFVVGIVAILRPEKDHATFLRAARVLTDSQPSARFVVVGDGPCRADIEAIVAELELESQVILTGARTDVEDLLPALDVFTLSSYPVETFPMSVLEAMACGVPVVATAVGGLPEMVADGLEGILVAPRDPEALASAWLELAGNEPQRVEMGARARRRVERDFTADMMTHGYEALFRRVVDRGADGTGRAAKDDLT